MGLKIYNVYTDKLLPKEKMKLEDTLDKIAFMVHWNKEFLQVTWNDNNPFPPIGLSLFDCRYEDVTNLQ